MTPAELKSWELERAQGRDSFILRGMWKRCIKFAIVSSIVGFLLDLLSHRVPSLWLGIWNCVVAIVVITVAGGWSEGVGIWYKREREYAQTRNTEEV